MPRYGFTSPDWPSPPPPVNGETLTMPSTPETPPRPTFLSTSSSLSKSSSSVNLSCLSPNGRMVFSLDSHQRDIECHALPLAGTTEDDDRDHDDHHRSSRIGVIRTRLPDHVVAALQRSPAVELLCIDVNHNSTSDDVSSAGPEASDPRKRMKRLPTLCLYSQKDVFVLEIGYMMTTTTTAASEIIGTCLAVKEPFDSVLLGNGTSLSIIKIRQAPQQQQAHGGGYGSGYVTMCPPEAMAMLTHDATMNEYSLTLHHGKEGSGASSSSFNMVTTPLVYAVEQLDDQLMMETLTDFVFLQSSHAAFSLLSNLSVAFLKATGEVFQASPILFRGTIVPHEAVVQSRDYLQSQMDHDKNKNSNRKTPRGRQLASAQQYLLDCFPIHESNTRSRAHFVTAQERSAAYQWPAQMQGPVLLLPESSDDSDSRAICLEVVPAGPLCGLAIGYDGYHVEFGLISPTLLVPRFQLEHAHDTMQLDQDLRWGAVVTKVDLRDVEDQESDHYPTSPCVALVKDPIMESVIHYVTPASIKSISTNALNVTAHQLVAGDGSGSGEGSSAMFSPTSRTRDTPIKTTGWSCLEVSNHTAVDDAHSTRKTLVVVGAVVSGDVQFGHVLVARLSNGSMVAVNLTETRQMQEMETMGEIQSEHLAIAAAAHPADASHTTTASKELQFLHDTPALVDVAKPLMAKALQGLRAMGKIVGSATPVDKITPDLLAAAAQIKEQTDKEVMLPIIELHEHVRARKKDIVVMFNNQMAQLKSVREMLAKLIEGEASIAEKLEIINENASSMAARGASVLQAAHDLQPTITQAEYDYFRELESLQQRTKQWEEQLNHLKEKASKLVDSVKNGTSSHFQEIPEDTQKNLLALLDGCDAHIKNYTSRVKEQEYVIDELAAAAGWDRDSLGEFKSEQ